MSTRMLIVCLVLCLSTPCELALLILVGRIEPAILLTISLTLLIVMIVMVRVGNHYIKNPTIKDLFGRKYKEISVASESYCIICGEITTSFDDNTASYVCCLKCLKLRKNQLDREWENYLRRWE